MAAMISLVAVQLACWAVLCWIYFSLRRTANRYRSICLKMEGEIELLAFQHENDIEMIKDLYSAPTSYDYYMNKGLFRVVATHKHYITIVKEFGIDECGGEESARILAQDLTDLLNTKI